jgi:hypothetical protein
LRDYLRSLVPPPAADAPGRSLSLLVRALERYLAARGERDVAGACHALLRTRVIQQADHSNLLLDPETFLNNWLFHLAAGEAEAPVAITSQCSTVACLSRRSPVRGPGFLWTRGGCYALFAFSRRLLKDSTFCALPVPTALTVTPLCGPVPPAANDPVLGPLAGFPVHDPADAFRAANAGIWDALPVDRGVRRVAVDERMASEAVALHLEEGEGAVFRLLFDPPLRDRFLEVKRALVGSPRNLAVNRSAPDFLWFRKGTQLRAVVLRDRGAGARWVMESDGSPLPVVPFEPAAVAAALRAGDLYADRVLAYLVRCLLPGVVAVGGTVQQDYVELYRQMLLETHAAEPFLDADELRNVADPALTRLGGAPLLEAEGQDAALLQGLGPATPLDAWARTLLALPVGLTVGRLDCADFYEGLLVRQRQRLEPAPLHP